MSFRLKAVFALALLSTFGPVPAALAQSGSPEALLAAVKNGPMQKLGPWLANLYDEFRQARIRRPSRHAIPC